MLYLIPLLALLGVSSALYTPQFNSHVNERIIGGKEVRKNSYPFMVRIESFKADGVRSLCGATLLHEDFVVTAAHCVHNSQSPITSLKLHFGDHQLRHEDDTQTTMDIPLANIHHHSSFSRLTKKNDIAIIKLPQKAPISKHVSPICVASASTVSGHKIGTAMGWGITKNIQDGGVASEVLKEVNLPILPHADCRLMNLFKPDTMICAGNTKGIFTSFCIGDSGGPFVVKDGKFSLVGITSFVSGKGCVADGYGVVFVRVSSYIPWLQDTMGSALCID